MGLASLWDRVWAGWKSNYLRIFVPVKLIDLAKGIPSARSVNLCWHDDFQELGIEVGFGLLREGRILAARIRQGHYKLP